MTSEEAHRGGLKSSPRSFCEPLWLPGWSDRSIWGYDEPTDSYFAQLWPDGDYADTPAVWIGAIGGLSRVDDLAVQVMAATAEGVALVEAALRSGDEADG